MSVQVFRASALVSSNLNHDVFEDSFLAIEGSKIIDLGEWKKRPRKAKVIELGNALIAPSLGNLHSHLPMVMFRGIAEDQSLEDWLFKTILPLEGKFLSPSFVRAGTELALCESIRNGVTNFCDMYLFEEDVAAIASKFGVRGLFCQGISGFDSPDYGPWQDSLEAAIKLTKKYANHARIKTGFGPHAAYSCEMETLKATAEAAKSLKASGMIHLSETEFELAEAKKKFGRSPLAQIKASGLLGLEHLVLAHSIWLEESDYADLKSPNLSLALNTQCNAKLASGMAPIPRFQQEKIRYCLGTDGAASNNNLDLFEEISFAAKIYRLETKHMTGLSRAEIFDAATIRTAEALGLEKITGSLEPGKEADFIVIDLESSHLTPMTDAYSHLVYSVRGPDVRSTYVGGKPLMKDRKLIGVDEKKIRSRAQGLWIKMKKAIGR